MGLRKRASVNSTNAATSTSQSSSTSTSSPSKRSRSENNNSPSQGNLNSSERIDSPPPPPPTKRSRSSKASTSAFTTVAPSKKTSKSNSKASTSKSKLETLAQKTNPNWEERRLPYGTTPPLSSMEGMGLQSAIPYMSSSMATYVGTATNLGKSPSVSYLDISNMTGNGFSGSGVAECKKSNIPLSFPGVQYSKSSAKVDLTGDEVKAITSSGLSCRFPNDSMFEVYQPWVIKTYGDLAKTKTITIKKYGRILRTLRGEEVNSAENSKFRFWVKSKGFHIGQPEGYDAKPADRIIGRHAVTSPGLDPPLYVPTQVPHNKSMNATDGSTPPSKVFKKVAIVENFFDIIHAVHVDLEGRPGKHAGQKRTYRTITETYAFLPREAVTRFLLGCTECQRRPRSPSPAVSKVPSNNNQTNATVATSTVTNTTNSGSSLISTPLSPTPGTAPSAAPAQSNSKPKEASHPPEGKTLHSYRHNRNRQNRTESTSPVAPSTENTPSKTPPAPVSTPTPTSPSTPVKNPDSPVASPTELVPNHVTLNSEKAQIPTTANKSPEKDNKRDEKYNPLSIVNLLKKDHPNSKYGFNIEELNGSNINSDSEKSPSSPYIKHEDSKENVPNLSSGSKRRRMLPEGTNQSSSTLAPLSRPWSPGVDTKNTPIDYSLPITTSYLKHYQRIQAEKDREMEAKFLEEIRLRQTILNFESLADCRRLPNTPSELIDTNLNLLTTIQQLHYQVMVALNEKLRYSNSGISSSPTSAFKTTDNSTKSIARTSPVPITNPSSSRTPPSFMLYPGVHIPISPDS